MLSVGTRLVNVGADRLANFGIVGLVFRDVPELAEYPYPGGRFLGAHHFSVGTISHCISFPIVDPPDGSCCNNTHGTDCVYKKFSFRGRKVGGFLDITISLSGVCKNSVLGRITVLGACLLLITGCSHSKRHFPIPKQVADAVYTVEVTGYCDCQKCCGWVRNWYGRPVYAYGSQRGKPKRVGETASGRIARKGTIAADTDYFPMGTVLYVPGYGYGRVEDRGGAIKGARLDLFYPSHREALAWGRKQVAVQVWYP